MKTGNSKLEKLNYNRREGKGLADKQMDKAKPKKTKSLTCYFCGGELAEDEYVIKPIPLVTKAGVRNYKRKFHLECVPKITERRADETASKEEDDYWDLCYKQFKSIIGVKEGQKLSNHDVMRIRGLRVGNYYPQGNNVKGLKRGYDYETILMTMKFSSGAIRKSMSGVSFKDQKHKTDYAMKIITNNINFIAGKVEANRATKNKVEKQAIDDDSRVVSEAGYKKKGSVDTTKTSEILKDLQNDSNEEDGIMSLFG